MKKQISLEIKDYAIQLLTNGAEEYENIVICFHGFNGNKWGDAYSGLKKRLNNSLVVSFDSCGHGDSMISSEEMRLDIILEEINAVIEYFKKIENKPIILVAVSYGAYRVMQYLIKYKPEKSKVVFINPAFRMLSILEKVKEFKYLELNENDRIIMKRSLNKFIKKCFLDDLFNNDLYTKNHNIESKVQIVVGKRDSLIPINDTLEIASRYKYAITYVDDEHCFENEENWNIVAEIVEESV